MIEKIEQQAWIERNAQVATRENLHCVQMESCPQCRAVMEISERGWEDGLDVGGEG